MTRLLFSSAIIFSSLFSASAQTTIAKTITPKGAVPKTGVIARSYDIRQLTGKWQEFRRRAVSSNSKISFTDSLQLDFNKRDSVIVRDGSSMSQKGFAEVEGTNNLEVAGDVYTIVSLKGNKLIINDGEFIRELHKKKRFYHETLGTIIIPKEDLSNPEVVNTKKVIGKWDVYRTQAVPGAAEDSAIIKHLSFTDIQADGSVTGEVTYIKSGVTESFPVKAIFKRGTLRLTAPAYSWDLHTYKADGKEFVFGHQGGLVYFAKQL